MIFKLVYKGQVVQKAEVDTDDLAVIEHLATVAHHAHKSSKKYGPLSKLFCNAAEMMLKTGENYPTNMTEIVIAVFLEEMLRNKWPLKPGSDNAITLDIG